ncbi:MAG TPA: c-type cytochrome, partial [Candidatus Binatia bacterium]|nr:c-type cytochrome [Candidatus Binatia bacterium]
HPFYLNRKLGPTPAVAPTIEHHHAEARSLTGGVVYYGDRLPDLNGAYIYGDYSSGTIWGARHDGSRVTWHKELARTELQIAAFAVNHHGELLIVDHGTGIYRLVPAPQEKATQNFPTRLSETGIFLSTRDHRVDPALIAYSVNTPGWADGAQIERFVGLPGDTQIELTNGWTFPNGAVLVQTLSLPSGRDAAMRRIETRLFTRQTGQWAGYSYRWNEAQSDATLVSAKGAEQELVVRGKPQTWRFPARAECMACHGRAATFVLGFTELQLNKAHDYGAVRDNQLRALQHAGLFNTSKLSRPKTNLVDAYDSTQILEARARSYLHVNCSVCHVEAGGGNAKMELGFTTKPERMNVLEARPQHDSFGTPNAMIIAPGDPDRSILYQRVSRRGRGQMPPVVSTVVDDQAAALFRDWIRSMKPAQKFVKEWTMEHLLPSLDHVKEGRSFETGRTAFRQTGCNQCHRFAGEGGSVGPDLTGVQQRLSARDLLESILLPSKIITEGFAMTDIETKSGDSITGRVESENEREIVIRPPLAPDAMTIRKSEIRQRMLSKTSNMPSGMLDTLDESQILDLLAYLLSDGNSEHSAFHSATTTTKASRDAK